MRSPYTVRADANDLADQLVTAACDQTSRRHVLVACSKSQTSSANLPIPWNQFVR